jgi:hypothetical protein
MTKHFALAASFCLLGACSFGADTKAAEDGVTAFHKAMDAGEYAAIYDGSASEMKSSISREGFAQLLGGLHTKLGSFRSGKTTGWNDNANTSGHFVTLNRDAQFQRGPGTEEFVFRIEKGKAVLAGYHVNSNLLVTG